MNARFHRQLAFTLIELMAAIGIAALLCVIGLGALNHVRSAQRESTCVANLRQVGLAMTLYTNEHNFQLPGPLWRGQSPVYQIGPEGGFDISKGNLAAFLGPYLRFEPLAPGGEAVAKVLTCPAWRSAAPESQDLCYYSAGEFQQEESMLFPFGRSGGDPIDPMRITAIANPATTPAFWEFDKDLTGGIGFYYTEPRVPAEPVHEKFRNVLYFDGHVSAKAVGLPLF